MLTVEHDLPAQPATNLDDPLFSDYALSSIRRKVPNADMTVIVDALSRCSTAFGTDRARFMRQTAGDGWTVHTLHQGSVTSHPADQAEIAMAWLVGLSRSSVRVTRPRVILPDGGGVRPISTTSYLGVPVVCQNHFAGVIELSGSDVDDLDRVLGRLDDTLASLGYCLIHDPAIRAPRHIDLDAKCRLDGGFWSRSEVTLDADEWSVLSLVGSSTSLRDAVASLTLSEERLIDVVHSIVSRGLVSVRATTREISHADDPSNLRP